MIRRGRNIKNIWKKKYKKEGSPCFLSKLESDNVSNFFIIFYLLEANHHDHLTLKDVDHLWFGDLFFFLGFLNLFLCERENVSKQS